MKPRLIDAGGARLRPALAPAPKAGWSSDTPARHVSKRMDDQARYEAAYRATLYRVRAGDAPFELRVDAFSARLAALMRMHGVATAAYLTAYNPRSVVTAEAANRAANERLRAALLAADAFIFCGEAIDPAGRWPAEPSFLALGLALATARELGTRFMQNAILFADDDAVPRLVWLPRAA